jgi:hypothetical protein
LRVIFNRSGQTRLLGYFALCCAIAFVAVGLAPIAARADTTTFLPTGAEQTFTVPAGVTTIHVLAVGGKGGAGGNSGEYPGGAGGFGAFVTADLPVSPGEVLYVEVGGNGLDGSSGGAGGFNGGGAGGAPMSCDGGGGGGASDVRTAPRSAGTSLSLRLITAAGGAGGGGCYPGPGTPKGDGGDAGMAGVSADGGGGQPGTATAGGAGGGSPDCHGGSGGLGSGGDGGTTECYAYYGAGGGGGGGGLYGGGGGGGSSAAGGGGGGSSGFGVGAANPTATIDNTGAPAITFTYTPSSGGTGGGNGGGGGGGGTPPPTIASLSALTLTHSVFAVGSAATPLTGTTSATRPKVGTTFAFQLDQAATVKIALVRLTAGRRVAGICKPPSRARRHKPKCTRTVAVGTLTRAAHAGLNKLPFSGRIGSRKLKPGRYRAAFTASNAAGTSAPSSLSFRIVRR